MKTSAINQATTTLATLMGATKIDLIEEPGGSKILYAGWPIPYIEMLQANDNPRAFLDLFIELWEESVKVIAIPRVKELEAKLEALDLRLGAALRERDELQRYKTAYELNR